MEEKKEGRNATKGGIESSNSRKEWNIEGRHDWNEGRGRRKELNADKKALNEGGI